MIYQGIIHITMNFFPIAGISKIGPASQYIPISVELPAPCASCFIPNHFNTIEALQLFDNRFLSEEEKGVRKIKRKIMALERSEKLTLIMIKFFNNILLKHSGRLIVKVTHKMYMSYQREM